MFLTTYIFNKLCTFFYGAWSWWWDTSNVLFPFTLIVLAITWYTWIFTNNSPRGLPVVGILPFLDLELHSCFVSLSQTYGPIMRLPMGTKHREMLREHDITFANRDVPELANAAVAKGDLDIVFSPYGPGSQMLRKVCVRKVRVGSPVHVGQQMFLTALNAITSMLWGGQERASIEVLLQLKNEGDAKTPLTMTHLKVLFMDMVLGGTETTSNAIEFAMAEMMNKPEVMKKAQQELETVVGKDSIAILKEVLRLHPVLSLMVPHCSSQTCIIGGYKIPKGARVFINVWAIHRDCSIWENPLEFRYKGADFNYFPFGSGRRMCAGIAMAERMFLFSLALILHSFDWKLPEEEKLVLLEKFGIVLKKKVPLMAISTPRLSNPTLYE
ncbi:hypothetical protein CsSME_00044793 [Camellia sinensis var. sinensis]